MRQYVQTQVSVRLRRLVIQAGRAARAPDAGAVHDLRVSIRRFSRALRAFEQFFPRRAVKRIRARLRELMKLAGQVRDRDIALELLAAAGLPARGMLMRALRREREQAGLALVTEIHRWRRRGFSNEWRLRLEL